MAEGKNDIDLYRGQVKRNKEVLGVLAADEDLQKTIDYGLSKGKYEKLLDLWVKGFVFDWNKLYGDINLTVSAYRPIRSPGNVIGCPK